MNWDDIRTHMRSRYRLHDDQPDMMSMVWQYDDKRKQRIVVRRFHAADREMLEFKSPFARKGQVDPDVLLHHNARLPLSMVAMSGDVYQVIYNVLLENLVLDDFDFLLARVAAVADTLEEKYVPASSRTSRAPASSMPTA